MSPCLLGAGSCAGPVMTAQTAATQGEDYALCKGVGTDDVADMMVKSAQTRDRLTRDPGSIVAPLHCQTGGRRR